MDWQPIETAPKDRRILLYWPNLCDGPAVYGGEWYDDKYSRRSPKPCWSADCESWIGKTHLREKPPTHWAEIVFPEDQ